MCWIFHVILGCVHRASAAVSNAASKQLMNWPPLVYVEVKHDFKSGSGSISNSPNFVTWWPLFNSQATLLIWSAHTVSLVRCGRPQRSFCQFCRTTWTLLLVVSLLLLQDSGTRFLWTVELLHLLLHLRPNLRHFSLLWHNTHCSTRLCTMARYKCIDWLIDWSRWDLH